ncbi:MAG: ankyrin repeat domain-containing protein [Thermodesulfovibrionales bacterium]|nr:ankyrin repeat domain-containing protein [Thermodesulfovibrionales bacterium]
MPNIDVIEEISRKSAENYGLMCAVLANFHKCLDFDAFIEYAVSHGELQALRYYLLNSPMASADSANKCAELGNLDALQLIFDKFGSIPELAVVSAAANGHAECLRYILERRDDTSMACKNLACEQAARRGYLECVKVCSDGLVLSHAVVCAAAESGCVDTFSYTLKLYKPHVHDPCASGYLQQVAKKLPLLIVWQTQVGMFPRHALKYVTSVDNVEGMRYLMKQGSIFDLLDFLCAMKTKCFRLFVKSLKTREHAHYCARSAFNMGRLNAARVCLMWPHVPLVNHVEECMNLKELFEWLLKHRGYSVAGDENMSSKALYYTMCYEKHDCLRYLLTVKQEPIALQDFIDAARFNHPKTLELLFSHQKLEHREYYKIANAAAMEYRDECVDICSFYSGESFDHLKR